MSYNPTSNGDVQASPKKDYRGIIYAVFTVALLATWGYMIFDKSKTTETVQQLQAHIVNTDSSKTVLQQAFEETSAKLDSLTGSDYKLKGNLEQKNKEVYRLKSNIASILKKKNASDRELADAKKMIDELNSKVEELYAEIDKLKGENQQLAEANQKLTASQTELQSNLVKTVAERDHVTDVASTLHASNINIEALKLRHGKEKETTTAKRADLLRISFDLDQNRITPSGEKDLYVCVVGPDGTPISKGETIATREEGDKKVTSKVSVNYEQGKTQPVSVDWKNAGKYQPGEYKVSIYQNGFKIGESTINLKKGGLFS
ncbi:MAG: hypothetical protein KGO81_07940 [Bacteroidota bacterium]|nr:hypothetical protein [Bacteroidota bacterium]